MGNLFNIIPIIISFIHNFNIIKQLLIIKIQLKYLN